MGRHRREVFSESQWQDVPAVVPARQLCFGDSPCPQQRGQEDDDGDDVEQGDSDRVRESIEDDLVDDVAPRADRVPAHTQKDDPEPFPDLGPASCSHLPARSDESPGEKCVRACACV